MVISRGNRITRRETCSIVTLSTKNLTCNHLVLNLGPNSEKPAFSHLRYDTVCLRFISTANRVVACISKTKNFTSLKVKSS
jgi:hypothetical protein